MSGPEKTGHVQTLPLRPRPFYVHLGHKLEDTLDDINWIHIAFKICAFTYIAFMIWITWHVLPLPGHWDNGRQSDRLPVVYEDLTNYFGVAEENLQCNVQVTDLYIPPPRDGHGNYERKAFCPNRKSLLEAMSTGGRIGFDAPYTPRGCHYRWYTIHEVCMILERFDGLIFMGDEALLPVYNALNILLRKDLANGALQTTKMDATTRQQCSCDNQFIKQDCSQHFVMNSKQISQNANREGSKYLCQRTPHAFLKMEGSELSQSVVDEFKILAPQAPRSNYKPIPIVCALSPSTTNAQAASVALADIVALAEGTKRKTPILWVGPAAAGHIEIRGRKGNQEIWDFHHLMETSAREKNVEVLGMWNMTVQANSWDGMRFAEKVALTQAMMIINWLGRLASS